MSLPVSSRLSCIRVSILLLGGLMAACQSKTDSGGIASQLDQKAAIAPPKDSPGTWYRCYRGTLGPETITLHLQTLPAGYGNRNSASFVGSYSGSDGQPYELNSDYDAIISADSVVLRDRSPELQSENSDGPIWRLHVNGKELLGNRAGQPVQLREVELPGSTSFISRYFTDSVAAYPNQPKSPHGRTSLHVLIPTNGSESARSLLATGILRGLRGDTLDTKAAPSSPEQFWEQQFNAFKKEYQLSVADLTKDIPAEPDTSSNAPSYDYMLRYEDQATTHVLWNQQNLLSLGFFTYSYTGGAHGNYGTSAVTFNTRTGHALRFPDVFQPNSDAQLSVLLEQAVRRVLHQPATVKLDEFLFVKKMPVSHNMYLTNNGAVFIYTPYEIASYAQGELRLFIPLEQLQPLLKPNLPIGRRELSKR
ncbi:DUF3298 and DUF4163 domain-containing protein [Hymenobacter volaticus]|uniref:DUF3298 and DUF4163 domain-containing protein n=1 Tax=Hymenobacter volaticus TaxID=2932254 RepID=A0ABY4G2U9_9BACT|nr:DUF3298 and DUF4163 domain-containing protein [Hymenobacter volaticus]UOQ65204.1 DUF3298 and DUF4163 domain-containing protein [Hymenobacter volaticus]